MKLGKILLLAVVLAFCSMQAKADEGGEHWIMYPVEKLGRGIANCAFGPLELPMKWYDTTFQYGGIAGLTYGTLKGVVFIIAREVVGIVDIITFPFPLPGCPRERDGYGWGYGPIMRPAWVIDVDHDWWNFVYDSGTMSSVSDY
jgi:putative exosortase-associated protein (TIGR04073 family)